MVRSPAEFTDEKERARDKRYRKAYRITLGTYNEIGETQGWRCGACGRHQSEFTVSLNVDHEHFKITLSRIMGEDLKPAWRAETHIRFRDAYLAREAKTQKAAKAALKDVALPLSIRGLLCPGRYTGCNRLLGRVDNPEMLRNFLAYLEKCPAHQTIFVDKLPVL